MGLFFLALNQSILTGFLNVYYVIYEHNILIFLTWIPADYGSNSLRRDLISLWKQHRFFWQFNQRIFFFYLESIYFIFLSQRFFFSILLICRREQKIFARLAISSESSPWLHFLKKSTLFIVWPCVSVILLRLYHFHCHVTLV